MKTSEIDLRKTLSLKIPGKGNINYSIKAGAGGGKTTLLSRRICRQIINGTPISEFVVITYTNAAAAELRDKISDQLREAADSATDAKERDNARNALNSIELVQISTIHSFLLKILRENAFEAGIVLDAKMLEADEDEARKLDFFNKWYRKYYKDIRSFADNWKHTEKTTGNERDVTREVFMNLFLDIANVREEVVFDTSDHTADIERAAKDYIDRWLPELVIFKNELLANLGRKADGTQKSLNNGPQTIVNLIAGVEGSSSRGCEEALNLSDALGRIDYYIQKGYSFYSSKGNDADIAGVIPDIPECELEWNFETVHTFMVNSQKAARAAEYVLTMQKAYQKECDEKTLSISNDDILFRAEKLLSTYPQVLDKLRSAYSKIYVDEFQDTTGLQARLIRMLSGKPQTDPGDDDLQDDKLIVVGDPKQSIYRFTGAEKAVYDDVDAMISAKPDTCAEAVSLDTNFRSNSEIVSWVNDKFSRLMPAEYSPMDTDWTVNEPNALSGVYKYEPDLGVNDKGNPISYKADHDVDAVVDLVDRLVDNEHLFVEEPVRNDDGTFGEPTLRKIQYSDIMIICKTTKKMKNYVEKFAQYGIPVNVQGKFTVTSDEVLRNFALLVEYFAGAKNRKKRLTAAQILCGLDATGVSKDELEKAEEELRKLREYFRDNSMDPAAIVRYLLSREDLFLPKGKEQMIERVREYRIRINQMAETCLANNDGDISRLSMLLDEYMEKEIKREIPLESNENAVRLMNVHQAKGLTGQIVIIADRSNTEKCWYSGFKSSGKYYPTVHFKQGSVDNSGSISYPVYGWDITRLLQAYREETSEAIRLQYVAATRAAHALIIMPAVYQEAWFTNEIYDYDSLPDINAWIDERENDTADYHPASLNPASAHATFNLQVLEANRASADIEKLSESRLASITPSGLEGEGLTGYSSAESGYVKEIRPAGGVFGTVMHRVFELMFIRYDMLEKMSAKEREKAIGRLINLAILESMDDMGKDDVPADMAAFLGSKMPGLYESVVRSVMADAAEIYPEYAFSFFVDDNERSWFDAKFGPFIVKTGKTVPAACEPIWINGQTDLAIKMKDGSIKVLDFKSDAMNGKPASEFEASLDSKYEGQLELYKYAIGKSFGVTDVQTELVHLYR